MILDLEVFNGFSRVMTEKTVMDSEESIQYAFTFDDFIITAQSWREREIRTRAAMSLSEVQPPF